MRVCGKCYADSRVKLTATASFSPARGFIVKDSETRMLDNMYEHTKSCLCMFVLSVCYK